MTTNYMSYGFPIEYEPMYCMSSLMWFNVSKCARERMTEYCHDIERWRGERRSFYSSIQKIDADSKWFMD